MFIFSKNIERDNSFSQTFISYFIFEQAYVKTWSSERTKVCLHLKLYQGEEGTQKNTPMKYIFLANEKKERKIDSSLDKFPVEMVIYSQFLNGVSSIFQNFLQNRGPFPKPELSFKSYFENLSISPFHIFQIHKHSWRPPGPLYGRLSSLLNDSLRNISCSSTT